MPLGLSIGVETLANIGMDLVHPMSLDRYLNRDEWVPQGYTFHVGTNNVDQVILVDEVAVLDTNQLVATGMALQCVGAWREPSPIQTTLQRRPDVLPEPEPEPASPAFTDWLNPVVGARRTL